MINKKLIEIYNLSQKDFPKYQNQKSVIWEDVLNGKNFEDENNLINFRKNRKLSEGVDDAINLQNTIGIIEKLELFDPEFLKKNLPIKNVGNSNMTKNLIGFYFDYGIIHHLKWFEDISKIIPKNLKVICEIGGGYGSLSRVILNNFESKYIMIDLPEMNLLSAFYLKEHFPNKNFYLYDDYLKDPSSKNIDNFDIFILPPWCVFNKNLKIDFFINARSMMEMNMEIVKKYFDLIHRHVSDEGFFLNINRYEKIVNNKKICIHEYPYDNNWDVIISKQSFLQEHIHFLLTQRKSKNFKNNIKDEIKKIKFIHDNTNALYTKGSFLLKIIDKSKQKIYIIIKKILLLFFKKNLKKIAKILYGMSN